VVSEPHSVLVEGLGQRDAKARFSLTGPERTGGRERCRKAGDQTCRRWASNNEDCPRGGGRRLLEDGAIRPFSCGSSGRDTIGEATRGGGQDFDDEQHATSVGCPGC
jgi:hypothetical protein